MFKICFSLLAFMNARSFFLSSLTFQFSFDIFFIKELLGGMLNCFGWVSKSVLPSQQHLAVVFQLLSRVWLCDPMNCSTPGFSVLHYLPEFAQTHVHVESCNHPTISSSVTPFSCLQHSPASGYFPMSWLFASGGQSIELLIFSVDFL